MALISFKDVGIIDGEQLAGTVSNPIIPIGFKTPLELDTDHNSIFKMHYSIKSQISDNLRNLVLTNHGERVGIYNFGANIRPLLTEFANKEAFDQETMKRIKTAVSIYMPFVELIGYESRADRRENKYTGIIKLLIAYSVPSAKVQESLLEVDMYIV